LLADTEPLHRKSYQQALGHFGVTVTETQYSDHWIRRGKGIEDFVRDHNLNLDISEVRKLKAESYDYLVRTNVQPMPGALALLNLLKDRKTLALASSSYRASVSVVIQTLKITEFFSCIAGNQDAPRLKPFPDLFLFVASQLNKKPAACLVIEDAEKGVKAARAAGMKCIAVPNQYTKDNDFSQADKVVNSLEEITLEMLDGIYF
jgi:HAD superfamily hydrolase (TIGR01509 family)